jgi:hypothetical protein
MKCTILKMASTESSPTGRSSQTVLVEPIIQFYFLHIVRKITMFLVRHEDVWRSEGKAPNSRFLAQFQLNNFTVELKKLLNFTNQKC